MCRKGNTQCLEMLFSDSNIEHTEEWNCLCSKRCQWLDTEKIYRALQGYFIGELRLAFGERTGRLGSKRQNQIAQYNFSPKNFVQLLRLCWAGAYFFMYRWFPVRVQDFDTNMHNLLMDIKTNPSHYDKEHLIDLAKDHMARLDDAYLCRHSHYTFDATIANMFLLDVYRPFIVSSVV